MPAAQRDLPPECSQRHIRLFAFYFHKGVHQLIMLLDFSNRLPQLIAPLRFGMQRAEYG
ncbi:hypothetical protein [Acinetobacter sp.]|uniref:hypothetical protein n=1 Tax=Acinetobacter sp. TaxID=472 RepID=UPI0035ADF1D7